MAKSWRAGTAGIAIVLGISGGASAIPPHSAAFHTTRASGASPPYPLDFEESVAQYVGSFNGSKLPRRFASDGGLEVNWPGTGWVFHPVAHAKLCTLAYGDFVRTGDQNARSRLVTSAAALLRRAERRNGKLLWRYGFANPSFGAARGWISGMAQGLAVACFAGARIATEHRSYDGMIAGAFEGMRAPFGNDGTAVPFGGGVFYEEVAGRGSRPAHILNGQIFALAGVWLAIHADDRAAYRAALDAGLRAVRNTVRQYETPGASLYDLGPRGLAPFGYYNVIHVAQLQWAYDVTRDPAFLEAAVRFMRFERRVRFSVEVPGGTSWDQYNASALATGTRVWRIEPGRRREARLRFGSTRLDGVHLVAGKDKLPAEVEVVAGSNRRVVRPTGRFFSVSFPPTTVSQVSLRIRAPASRAAALQLVTLKGDETRGLAALSSDLSAYRSTERRHPINLFDRDRRTVWSSRHTGAALFVELGSLPSRRLALDPCDDDALAPPLMSFGSSLNDWEPYRPSLATVADIPPGARYLRLLWPAGGCLAGLRPA